jgi:riboflavin synthase
MNKLKTFSYVDMAKLSEDELKKHYVEVRSNINKNKRLNLKTKDLEIYICYVIREIESRNFVQK